MSNTKSRLSSPYSESMVIGALMHHHDWLDGKGISLKQEDFAQLNNQVMYSIIRERWVERNFEISSEAMAVEAEKHPTKGRHTITPEMTSTIKSKIGEYSFETFQKEVSLLNNLKVLRRLYDNGFDVERIIGPDSIETPNINNTVSGLEVEEIINLYRTDLDTISESVELVTSRTSIEASDGLRELLVRLQNEPQVGTLQDGDIYNAITRGALHSRYHINSSPSGVGKTRMKLGNAVSVSMPRILPNGMILHRRDGYDKALFITTELTPEEMQTMLVACVSGVEEESIKSGDVSLDDYQKIEDALTIIEMYSSNLHIEQISDPSVSLVKAKLETHIRRNQVTKIYYDYIFGSPALSAENPSVREDVALMYLSTALKEVATENDVFVSSSTQVNGMVIEEGARDVNMVRGSKAIVDKADIGMVTVDIGLDEEIRIDTIVETLGCVMPNIVTDVYKNRGGRYKGVKIFRYFDKGTCRMEDLFMTNDRYEPIAVAKTFRPHEEMISLEELVNKEAEETYELS